MQQFQSFFACIALYGCYNLEPLPSSDVHIISCYRTVEYCGNRCLAYGKSKFYAKDNPARQEIDCWCLNSDPTGTNIPNLCAYTCYDTNIHESDPCGGYNDHPLASFYKYIQGMLLFSINTSFQRVEQRKFLINTRACDRD